MEQWRLSVVPMHARVRAKLMVHWLGHMLPLVCLSPIIALLFGLNTLETGVLVLSLLCGTPMLFALCAFSATFGLGLTRQGLFTALIVLPLTLPVMIFGGGVLTAIMHGLSVRGHLALLLAGALLAFWGLPYAIAAVIRVGVADAAR